MCLSFCSCNQNVTIEVAVLFQLIHFGIQHSATNFFNLTVVITVVIVTPAATAPLLLVIHCLYVLSCIVILKCLIHYNITVSAPRPVYSQMCLSYWSLCD